MNLVLIGSWVTFSPGGPYRRPFYTNRPLLVLIALALVTCGFVMFYRGAAWTSFLQMMYAPYAEYYLVVAAFVNFMGLLSYIWEAYVIQGYPGIKAAEMLHRLRRHKPPFEVIEEELKRKKNWPPLKQSEDIAVDDPCTVAVEAPSAPEKTTGGGVSTTAEEIYASGILKKPSFRLASPWRAESAAAAAGHSGSEPASDSFGTFRPGSRPAPPSSTVSHRHSIILEEVPMVLPPAQPDNADSEC
ncbi:hypothetical protein FJT64_013118 [Amphibalanus amphitrite]|uniref:Uncharacterized protein n=1 Tax=Amphibalanus amphitrite TaxID=1232801 RepID=A0A6A4VB80_AMPAM|nr:hypothetical protein FJT64_013118 [Amphibalanus amphitrite]